MTENVKMPKHVAVIMDGNGRWAEKQGVTRVQGHNAGMLAMKEIISKAKDDKLEQEKWMPMQA